MINSAELGISEQDLRNPMAEGGTAKVFKGM